MAQGHAGCACLVIFTVQCLREQLREQRYQRRHVRRRQRMPADALQPGRQLPLVLAVAAQVEQAVFQHQRRVLGDGIGLLRRRHPRRCTQLCQPVVRGRPLGHAVQQPLRLSRIKPGVALRHRQRGQRRRQRHALGRVVAQPLQAGRQRVIKGAQLALLMQFLQQAHALAPRARAASSAWACSPPANNASSASTNASGKRSTCTPLPVPSRPRQNR